MAGFSRNFSGALMARMYYLQVFFSMLLIQLGQNKDEPKQTRQINKIKIKPKQTNQKEHKNNV
jgi:hypothetical protein